ncbi:hypothetical protein HK096_010214, partial [Nowakowskiella sp. JEL0078]
MSAKITSAWYFFNERLNSIFFLLMNLTSIFIKRSTPISQLNSIHLTSETSLSNLSLGGLTGTTPQQININQRPPKIELAAVKQLATPSPTLTPTKPHSKQIVTSDEEKMLNVDVPMGHH